MHRYDSMMRTGKNDSQYIVDDHVVSLQMHHTTFPLYV